MKKLFNPAKITLHVITILAMVFYPGGFALVQNSARATDICSEAPFEGVVWNVKYNIDSGFEYGSEYVSITVNVGDPNSISWSSNSGYVITRVCVKEGGPGGGTAHDVNPADGGAGPYSYDISHLNIVVEEKTPTGSIEGTKYYDWDRNAETSAGDQPLEGWTIFLDMNENDQFDPGEPSAITDANGNYSFTDLEDLDYDVCELLPNGWAHTPNPAGISYDSVYCKGSGIGQTVNFYNYLTGAIHGQKWNDLNGNQIRDCSFPDVSAASVAQTPIAPECEPLLNGWTIFIDENEDGVLNGEEQSMQTQNHNGQDGWYWFEDLQPGTYSVCEVPQPGWNQTYPLNDNNNCHTITVPQGSDADTCFNPRTLRVDVVENAVIAPACNFGNKEVPTGDVTFEKVILGDGNPASWTFTVWDGDTEVGTYEHGETVTLPTGSYTVTENGPDGYQFVSADGICSEDGDIYMSVNEDGGTCTFTNQEIAGSISGQKFHDLDEQGDKDAGEPGLPGWTIQLWTSCTLPDVDLNQDGAVTLSDAVLFTAPYLADFHKPGVPASMANVNHDVMVTGLDKACMNTFLNGTPSVVGGKMLVAETVTDANGNYTFGNLNPGTYWISEVLQNGWEQSFPASLTYGPVDLAFGQDVTGYDFGNHHTPQLTPSSPTLTITKDVDKTSVVAGANVTYTVTITNTGTGTANNVTLADPLPGAFYITLNNNTELAQSFGNLEAGKAVTTTYTVTVPVETTAGDYVNTATAKADNYGNVSDTATVAVQRIPQVLGVQDDTQVEKLIDPGTIVDDTPRVGQVLGASDLAETGAGMLEYALMIFGAVLLAVGISGIRTFNTKKSS